MGSRFMAQAGGLHPAIITAGPLNATAVDHLGDVVCTYVYILLRRYLGT